MTALIIDDDAIKALSVLHSKAVSNPVPMSTLRAMVAEGVELDDYRTRDEGIDNYFDGFAITLIGGWKIVFTIEDQPMGRSRHLSMSSPVAGKIPTPEAIDLITQALGFTDGPRQRYMEEFAPNHVAINVVQLLA